MFGCGKASKMSEMELSDLNIEIENERLLSRENRGGDKVSPSDATMVDSASRGNENGTQNGLNKTGLADEK